MAQGLYGEVLECVRGMGITVPNADVRAAYTQAVRLNMEQIKKEEKCLSFSVSTTIDVASDTVSLLLKKAR